MSVRAHRVNEIVHEQAETFNLWHDKKLIEFFEGKGILTELNADACGLIDISVELLKETIEKVEMDDDTKQASALDIVWAEKEKMDFVQYYCF